MASTHRPWVMYFVYLISNIPCTDYLILCDSFNPTLTSCRTFFLNPNQRNSDRLQWVPPDCVRATASSLATLTMSSARMVLVPLTRPQLFFFISFFIIYLAETKAQGERMTRSSSKRSSCLKWWHPKHFRHCVFNRCTSCLFKMV